MPTDKYPHQDISNELFAQYIDGASSPEDSSVVLSAISQSSAIREEFLMATKATAFVDNTSHLDMDGFTMISENDLLSCILGPSALNSGGGLSATSWNNSINNIEDSDRLNHWFGSNNENTNHINFGNMSNGIIGTGNPIVQSYPDTCAIKSQQIVLQEFGIDVSEDQLVQWSQEHNLYTGNGTNPADVGVLLQQGGIPTNNVSHASVFDLVDELAQGHKVIVGVDSGELWKPGIGEWWEDVWNGDAGADHALIVAGIDNTDPSNPMVLLTDPGAGDLCKSYSLDQFMDAWKDSDCRMISTQISPTEFADVQSGHGQSPMHLSDIAGNNYSDFQIFHDVAQSLPDMGSWDYLSGMHPVNSLTQAYLDYAQTDNLHDVLNSSYDFMNHVDSDLFLANYSGTFTNGCEQIMPNPLFANSGLDHFLSGNPQADVLSAYFQDQASLYNGMGDEQLSDFFDQQAHFTEFCQSFGVNPTDMYCSDPSTDFSDLTIDFIPDSYV